MMDMGSTALAYQWHMTPHACIAGIMQRLAPGTLPLLGLVERMTFHGLADRQACACEAGMVEKGLTTIREVYRS